MGSKEVRAGGAYVEFSTKDNTDAGLSGIKSKITSFGRGIAKVGGLAIGAGSAAAGAASAAVMKAVDMGSTIKDMADRFGLSYQAVQQLGFAADQSGASLEGIILAIKKMQQGLGNGTIADDLAKIGVSAEQIKGLAPEKQFALIASAIGKITDPSQRTAAAMAIFGKAGTDLIPLLNDGADGVEALIAQFDKMGIAMSDQAVEQAEKLGDEIDALSKKFNALTVGIGTSLIPMVESLIAKLEQSQTPEFQRELGGILERRGEGLQMAFPVLGLLPDLEELGKDMVKEADRRTRLAAEEKRFGGVARSAPESAARRNNEEMIAKAREGLMAMFGGIGDRWQRIGAKFDRDKRREDLRDLRALQKELASIGSGTGTFGTFDKRDIAGGAYLSVSQKQLDAAKRTNELLEEIKKKKAGLGVM